MDAIVNTAHISLELNQGAVSMSILTAAGPNIQLDCKKNRPTNFKPGDVVVTPGHNLQCHFVYHGAVISWDNGSGGCEQIIRKFLQNIFRQALVDKLTSIAIPAVGTGNLKVPHDLVAHIMFQEVANFSRRNPQTLLKHIEFVVFDKDKESIRAFEAELKNLISPQPQGAVGGSAAFNQSQARPGLNYSFMGGSQAREAASGDSYNVSYNQRDHSATIGSLTMDIKQGNIINEQADAIVNSTNSDLSLTTGMVSVAIANAGGDVVRDDCQKGRIDEHGIFVSRGGKLPAKHIIHLVAASDQPGWMRIIENCLIEAERRKFAHISFPLLGTGNASQSAGSMATTMLHAICQFEVNMHPKLLKKITVCIFQPEMIKEFSDAVAIFARYAQGMHQDNNFGGARSKVLSTRPSFSPPPKRILQIYALDASSIQKVIGDLQLIIRETFAVRSLESKQDAESIKKCTEEQIAKIKSIEQRSRDISIEIERSKYIQRINIRSPVGEMVEIIQEIYHIFKEADYLWSKKIEADFVKKMVNWCREEAGKFVPYPDEINVLIEKAHAESREFAEWDGVQGSQKFKIIFKEMVEESASTRTTVKRNVREITPANWDKMGDAEMWKTVPLAPTSAEYLEVEKNARASSGTTLTTIVKIERVQNLSQYKQYCVKKEALEKKNPSIPNERILFHGTDVATTEKINSTVFNRSLIGDQNGTGTAFGQGSYFGVNFSYSADKTISPVDPTTNLQHVYQCRVLTGNYAVGSKDLRTPPAKLAPANGFFDSVVDNVTTPNLFVVFYDDQAYPEYLIYFN